MSYVMQPRSIMLALELLVALVVGMFTYTYLAREQAVVAPVVEVAPPAVVDPYGITRIEATHFFIDGVHTIVGEVTLPTPCDLLTTAAQVAESMPEQVTFQFTVVNNSEMCATVQTTQRFMVSASASDQARLSATFNGVPVELNLKTAAPGETPEDFEVYIKG